MRALLMAGMVCMIAFAGCLGGEEAPEETTETPQSNNSQQEGQTTTYNGQDVTIQEDGTATVETDNGTVVIDLPDDVIAELKENSYPLIFNTSQFERRAAEPNVGITSSGCVFMTAMEEVMRSCDNLETWEPTRGPLCQPTTSDPYLWVDPVTDRIFNVQMVVLVGTWICWSDDDGATWLGNPYDQGPLPVNDHIKLATGPYTDAGYGAGSAIAEVIYPQATYFCYNKLAGVFCYTSFDGGATFPVGGLVIGLASTGGGLHGSITTAPDGTVYVPIRTEEPLLAYSKDNGLTWQTTTVGADVGTPNPRKNAEIGTDTENNAYQTWIGGDNRVYLSRSTDSGVTWDATSIPISPEGVISTTFPHIDAGSPGRIAVAYLGSEDSELLGTPDIDGNDWRGNPHYAPRTTQYHMYVTYSLNALNETPVFKTVRVSEDPVQVGSICISSGDCRSDDGGSNRNLLDFNDLHFDNEGRVFIGYADGCTGECATSDAPTADMSRTAFGTASVLTVGPSLFEDVDDFTEY